MQADGRVGRARLHARVTVRLTADAVDGDVLLFATEGPRAADPAAVERWLADWDARGATDFSLAALAAQQARGAACETLGVRAAAR